MKKVWIFSTIAVVILLAVSFTVFSQKPVQNTPTAVVELNADTIFNLVNEERTKAGLAPLVRDSRLDESAQIKADDMNANNYFAHINPETGVNGYTLIPSGICSYKSENIIENSMFEQAAVNGWMASKPHHDAILDAQYDSAGLAVSGNKVVQHFCNLK